MITIRPEASDDYREILRLTYEAFLTLDYPGRQRMDEHFLIHLLRGSQSVIRELSFVAEMGGKIVGHILYTPSKVLQADGKEIDTITFGPLSVLPEYHRQGVGRLLVRHSMDKARELGFSAVLITGVPEYYPRLGFKRAREYGLMLEDGAAFDAFMAYELRPGYLSGGGTVRFLPGEFVQCETDEAGYERFHKAWMAECFPGQVTLRTFWEQDVALVKRWLAMPHVAKWYEHPNDWLCELENRHGEFAFITHCIAEFEGNPIGFCQYYDCFAAQKYEAWNETWRVDIRPGVTFSIDYLIGEPEYLRKGYGREMVRLLTEKVRKRGGTRILVQPDKGNTPSGRALEANDYRMIDGEYVKDLT